MQKFKINLIINTPVGREGKYDDSYIRKAAIRHKIPYITTIAAAKASVEGIESIISGGIEIKALQDYHIEQWKAPVSVIKKLLPELLVNNQPIFAIMADIKDIAVR